MGPPILDDKNHLPAWLADLFPTSIIMEKARKSGFVKRLRKLNPKFLLFVLVFSISSHSKPSLEEFFRRYNDFDDTLDSDNKIKYQSFSNRFNEDMVKFLREMLDYYIDSTLSICPARLKDPIKDLKDIWIQDSSIIRLSDKLAKIIPAARTKGEAAGLKIHAVYSAVSHSLNSLEITGERVHDSKKLKIGPNVKGVLFLSDLGYYSNSIFAKINDYGGFFVSRLKTNATPKLETILTETFPNKEEYQKGTKLNDLLEKAPKEGMIDLICSFTARFNPDGGKVENILVNFRVVCFWDTKTRIWHTYVTNLPKQAYSTEEIYQLYRYRWIIELLFKELKGDYDLGNLHLAEKNLAYAHVYSMIIRLLISRNLYKLCVQTIEEKERYRYGPMLWSKVLAEKALEFLSILNQAIFGDGNVLGRWNKLESSLRDLAKSRHKNYSRLSLDFIAF